VGGERPPAWPVARGRGHREHARVRACVLIAAVAFGVLAVPAIARADPGSSSTTQLLQQADAAVSNAQALASQEVAAASSPVSAATPETPASVPTAVASAESEATKAVSEAVATAEAAAASSSAVQPPARTAQTPAPRPAAHPQPHRAAIRSRHPAVRKAPWSERSTDSTSSERSLDLPQPAPPPHANAHAGSATRHRSAVPHRLPPLPAPPQGSSGSVEASGSGAAPLLVAALGAVLFAILFESLSRLLPRSAFRKPRHLALPPWHPG
jgi:hypothetical protein